MKHYKNKQKIQDHSSTIMSPKKYSFFYHPTIIYTLNIEHPKKIVRMEL
jgi:hypothetical protein